MPARPARVRIDLHPSCAGISSAFYLHYDTVELSQAPARQASAPTNRHAPIFHMPEFRTLAVRAGQVRTQEGEHAEPIFTTSSYVFRNAAEAAARFAETEKGNIYSRFTNPTVRCFEERLAALEGGAACVATASGMAAILATCMSVLKAGDHLVCSESVF